MTTPRSRALIVQRTASGWTARQTAAAFGVSVRTVHKWRARYRAEGRAGLADRRSVPRRSPTRTPPPHVAAIVRLRARRLAGAVIARRLGLPRSTVGTVLRRAGLGRLGPLTPPVPVRRYQRQRPGELLHLDTKPFARIARIGHRIHGDLARKVAGVGYEHAHVAIDDASRVAYVEVLPTARIPDAVGFLERALAWFAAHGIRVEEVMTDNGSAYVSRVFAASCGRLSVRHLRTRPYTPRTNGKAERFIQTLCREWAYRRPYTTSQRRQDALRPYLRYYNRHRPHTALNYATPISRLREAAA